MAWRRLHPIAVVTALIESVRSAIALILPVLAIAVPNRDSAVVMAVIVAVIGLIAAWMLVSPVVRWLTTGYRMDDHGITQRSGVFNRTRTTIAYDHIHTLSSSAPIYMRPFHVVILDITAAGGESGMTLRGVPAGVQLELEAGDGAVGDLDAGGAALGAHQHLGAVQLVAQEDRRRQERRAPQAGFQQGRAPQGRAAGPLLILQKAPDHAPGPIRRDQDAERRGRPQLPQAIRLPDRLLQHAPGRRQPGQQLDARPRGQNGPGMGGHKFLSLHPYAPFALPLVFYVLHFLNPFALSAGFG